MAEVVLHPLAQREAEEATGWYLDRSVAAGERFAAALQRLLDGIAENPERHGWYDDDHREAVMIRYPYHVLYRILDNGNAHVIAIAHASRRPDYWRDRA
ncbi:MAG: type II toxin-antitoxin system RelE/ParE family toxin [Gemmataceae bacterium]|nr:type II toxin-antitoxin system RelE/ParE family toxin [Gemmataceae bacterium]